MRLTIRLTRNAPGDAWAWTGQCVEFPGAISEGNTQRETVDNVLDAVREILAARREEARIQVKKSRPGARPRLVVVHG